MQKYSAPLRPIYLETKNRIFRVGFAKFALKHFDDERFDMAVYVVNKIF